MSGVFKRLRKETDIQFLKTAWELQKEVITFVMKEKNVPKKWRIILGLDTIKKVNELVDNLNYANCIYPTNAHEYTIRAGYQQKAISNIWQLQNKLVVMIECIESVKIEKMSKIIELLDSVEILVKKWKKADKERNKKLLADYC